MPERYARKPKLEPEKSKRVTAAQYQAVGLSKSANTSRQRGVGASDIPQERPAKPRKLAGEPEPVLPLRERALDLVRKMGTVRTKDLEAIGVPRQYPGMMCKEGLLEQIGYGRYRVKQADGQ